MSATSLNENYTGTLAAIYEIHERATNDSPERDYTGWSAIGHPCELKLFYDSRWVTGKQFDGRIARLFITGHLEESRVIKELKMLPGVKVYDTAPDGGQFAVTPMVRGHLRGHLDCVVKNLPEYPGEAILVDVKTANKNRFDRVVTNGMAAESPQYVAQAQGYMGLMNLKRAAYFYVCKDDDRLHIEWLEFDQVAFDQLVAKAERIIFTDRPPMRGFADPTDYQCRYCDHKPICWDQKVAAKVNCRTCKHVTPADGGAWMCSLTNSPIPLSKQRIGCSQHVFIPQLVPFAEVVDVDHREVTYRHKQTGKVFTNVPDNKTGKDRYSSEEIKASPHALGDETVDLIREAFDGRLTDA